MDIRIVSPSPALGPAPAAGSKMDKIKGWMGITDDSKKLKFIRNRILDAAEQRRLSGSRVLYDTIHQSHGFMYDPMRLTVALLDVFEQADLAALSRGKEAHGLRQRAEGQSKFIVEQKTELAKRQGMIEDWTMKYTSLDSAKDHMERTLRGEIEQLKQAHKLELNSMRDRYESQLAHLRDTHETERTQDREAFEDVRQQMENYHESQVHELQEAAAEQEAILTKDIQELNQALVTRERYKPISDAQLQRQFSDLIDDVDYLARLEWREDRSEWSPAVVSKLSDNARILKKQILQDIIWTVLHDHIFCSPFRVFGQEGQRLESIWNEAYGKGSGTTNDLYSWPDPDHGSERWRYEAALKCQEVLGKPISEHHPSVNIKRGFQQSLQRIHDTLANALEEVAFVDDDEIRLLGDLARNAATMWVAFCTQRCRLLVQLHGSGLRSERDKIAAAQDRDGLLLVEKPELRRFGNAQGGALHTEDIVSGCRGETVTVTMRPGGYPFELEG